VAVFTIADGGAVTGSTYNGQTISSAASFSGSLTVATNATITAGNLTFSGTTARSIIGPGTGGLTVGVTAGPLTLSTTTSGTLSVTSAAALALTGTSVTINTTGTGTTSIGNATGTFALNSNTLDISTGGALTGVTGITTSGGYTQSGTTANTLTGATTITPSMTVASATSVTWNGFSIGASTLTLTGATSVSSGTVSLANIAAPTITSASALTVTNASTLTLGAPTAAGSTTITNAYALIASGRVALGTAGFGIEISTGGAINDVDGGVVINDDTDVNGTITLNLTDTATTNGVCHSGSTENITATNRSLVVCSTTPNDYAEFYPAEQGVAAGDIIATTNNMLTYEAQGADAETGAVFSMGQKQISIVKKASAGDNAFGIVSTAPYQTIGKDIPVSANRKPIAMNGRVPVKVNNEGGAIAPGDRIALSSVAGHGKKATEASFTVGVALESFNGTTGQIMVYVQNTYYAPPSSAPALQGGSIDGDLNIGGSLTVSGPTTLATLTVTGNVTLQKNLTVVGDTTVANITIGGKIITAGDAPESAIGADAKGIDASVNVEGNDTAGKLAYLAGTTDIGHTLVPGQQMKVTFKEAFAKAPRVALTPKDAGSAGVRYYVETTETGFTVHFLDAPAASTTYSFDYIIIQ